MNTSARNPQREDPEMGSPSNSTRRPVVRRLALCAAVTALAALGPASVAGAAVAQSQPNAVAQSLEAAGGSGSPISDPAQYGIAGAPLGGFPTAGGSFGLLSSGDVTIADAPNSAENSGTAYGLLDPARGDAFDPVTLKADFVVPDGQNCLQLDYKFLSEEFPEYVDKGVNDTFIAELDNTSWSSTLSFESGDPVYEVSAPGDFAAGYGDQVAVDTLGPTSVSAAESSGTTYDAATGTLTAETPVTPGPHSIYLSIFDLGDAIYDSAVFVDNLRFTAESPSSCRPPDLFAGEVGAGPAGSKVQFKGGKGEFKIKCQLPAGSTDPCVGTALITASAGGNKRQSAHAKKTTKVAKGKYSVQPASKGKVTVKLTREGKRLLKKQGKVKAGLKLTNTINGKSQSFKVNLRG